jgi:C4-dicarboxylate-binding protein DctP
MTLAGCGNDATKDEAILIKFPHVTAPSTPKGQAADHFKALVDERLAGRVTVEVFPSDQLMNDDDSLEALAFGEVQMIAVSLSKFDRLTHKFQVFDLPFLFPDLETVEKFQAGPEAKLLLNELNDRGIQGLTFWHNGMKQFGGNKALRRPEDAAGLSFRIMESDVLQAQMLQIGGNPQKMAFSEVYMALQTGAVDAQENTWSNTYASKFYEVLDYVTESNHGYVGYLVAVNPGFWKTLPGEIRIELENIANETAEWANARAHQINQDARQKISDSGKCEILELSQQELEAWQTTMKPVWEMFKESIGPELIQAALDTSRP